MWTYRLFNDYQYDQYHRIQTIMGMVVVVDLYKDGRFSGWSSRVGSVERAMVVGSRTCDLLNAGCPLPSG